MKDIKGQDLNIGDWVMIDAHLDRVYQRGPCKIVDIFKTLQLVKCVKGNNIWIARREGNEVERISEEAAMLKLMEQ